MAQILQGLSHKVCSTISLKVLAFGSFILTFEIFAIIHQQLVCYGCVGSTYEISDLQSRFVYVLLNRCTL